MSDDSLNEAMRRAGFQRCHRYWLTPEQMELVAYMAEQNLAQIKQIKRAVRREAEQWGDYPRRNDRHE